MSSKFEHQLLHLVTVLEPIPEKNLVTLRKAPFCLVEKPSQVLIVLLDGPYQFREVFLDARENIISNIRQPSGFGDCECGKVCQRAV